MKLGHRLSHYEIRRAVHFVFQGVTESINSTFGSLSEGVENGDIGILPKSNVWLREPPHRLRATR
jgi:hypothetical protein